MEIQLATLNDIPELTSMNIDLRRDEQIDNEMQDFEIEKRMESFLLGKTYKVFFLVEQSIVLGYCVIDVVKSPMYLRQLFIKKDFRKKGNGKEFIRKIVNHFNLEELDIEVMSWNTNAVEFYEKNGFKKRYLGMRYKKEE